jgi:beta-glucosidase
MTSSNDFTALTSEEIEAQARQLLSQLTLEEKVEIMDADTPFWSGMAFMMNGGYNKQTWDAGIIDRLGIQGIRFIDGPRGVMLPGATTFPVSMARGATWDPSLEERVGEIIGTEIRALGGTFFGGVCINLPRHPAWGRSQETYGEDPYLLGEMGAALTRGVQRHAMACAKHYTLNSMENARFKVDVSISPRALHEVYLPHFKRCVEEGVAAVMSAYNSVNGEWCGQNKVLLTDILKKKWGFDGFVMTDFIFGMRDAKKAALAGQDVEMPFHMHFHQHLKDLVEIGEVPLERVDDAVLRVLHQQIKYVRPGNYTHDMVGSESSRAVAREASQKSIVLLKNDDHLLPLTGTQNMAVIGRLAALPNTGDDGSSNTQPVHVVTPLEGLQQAMQGKAEILFEDGSDLERVKSVAKAAEVVLLVVGYDAKDEGEFLDPDTMKNLGHLFPPPSPVELPTVQAFMAQAGAAPADEFLSGGDRSQLTLSVQDEALIQAVATANPKTIVALMGGSAIIMEAWRKLVPSILMIWYPGMEGGYALADILLGRVNPSGKLPLVIPTQPEHLPFYDKNATAIEYDLWHGYRKLERDGNLPAFPFGFGLSYTNYRYSDLRLEPQQLSASGNLTASLEVTNSGSFAGEEVVQLYVSALGSQVERAPKELKAFARVTLLPGETKEVKLSVPVSQLAYYDEAQEAFVVEPIEYEVFVGAHSLDPQALKGRFVVVKRIPS